MAKSSSTSAEQVPSSATNPLHDLARVPTAIRRAYAAVHRFVEQFEAEIDDAVHAARTRQLAAVRRVEQIGRHLHTQHPAAGAESGTTSKKPRGFVIEPEVMLAIKALDAAPLADCLGAIRDSILALEPYEGVPFKRKPIMFRNEGGQAKATMPGPEDAALAALELAGQNLVGLFRGLAKRLAARCTTRARKKSKTVPSDMLTPPQVAERLGVSPEKVRGWIAKGELPATNVAAGKGGRPRYRISETDLADFQKKRQPAKPPARAPRRRKKDPNVIEFFK